MNLVLAMNPSPGAGRPMASEPVKSTRPIFLSSISATYGTYPATTSAPPESRTPTIPGPVPETKYSFEAGSTPAFFRPIWKNSVDAVFIPLTTTFLPTMSFGPWMLLLVPTTVTLALMNDWPTNWAASGDCEKITTAEMLLPQAMSSFPAATALAAPGSPCVIGTQFTV